MSETTTMLTDYALAAVTAVLGVALVLRGAQARPVRVWGWAFLALAAAGALGGTWHGLRENGSPGALAWLWMLNEWAIGLFGLGAIAATADAALERGERGALVALAAVGCLVFFAWTWGHDRFGYVLTLDVVVMVVVLFLHGTALRRHPGSPWIVAGIAVSALAAVSQTSTLSLGPLNHNDIFHLIQLTGMVLLFLGARQLGRSRAA